MTTLREDVAVPLPAAEVQDGILRFFQMQRRADGGVELPLRVSLADFGLPDAVSIERDVVVRINKRRDAENINDEIAISWSPADGGPYPAFDGRIVVWSEDNPTQSFIELEGNYAPPMGRLGEAFDETIGYLIAQRTAHEFLENLRDSIAAMKRVS